MGINDGIRLLEAMKISNECEVGNFSITEECDCEHCRTLKPFTVTWCDGGTWWCLDCAQYDYEKFELTDEFKVILLHIQKGELTKYHTQGLIDVAEQKKIF